MKTYTFLNSEKAINDAVLAYLGSGKEGGYQPIGDHEQRLRDAFPHDWQSLKADVNQITKAMWDDIQFDLNRGEEQLLVLFPWLNPITRRALVNYFSYCEK